MNTPRTDAAWAKTFEDDDDQCRAGNAATDMRDACATLERELTALTAERDELRGALALGQQNCDDVYDELRADCDELRADVVQLTARAERAEAELATERARLRQVALDACKSAQIKPMVWYPKGYNINPNDLGKINEQQVEACVAAIDAAMKEDSK